MKSDVLQAQTRPFPKRSFWFLFVITALGVGGIFVVKLFADFFNEQFNLNPGVPNVALIFGTMLGVILWSTWLMFWARKWVLGGFVLLLPLAWVVLFHPNFGGDAEILEWRPRFWRTEVRVFEKVDPSEIDSASQIDLTSPSEFDFPQFLGANRDGIVHNVSLDSDWKSNPPKLLWKKPIGEGWSGFAIVNGFAVTQEQRDDEECVSCYEVDTGRLVWIYSKQRRHEDLIKLGKTGPRATPTIDNGLVYTMGGTGVLDCLNGSNGELVWSVDVAAAVGVTKEIRSNELGQSFEKEDSSLDWGRAGSPLIYEDLVIVSGGGPTNDLNNTTATLLAYDKATGKEVWRGGKRQIAYGSPSLALIQGSPQILLVAESFAVGHDPETGAELWSHVRPGSSNAAANCSQVTFIGGNRLLFSKGYNLGGEMVELEHRDSASSEPEWQVITLKSDHRILKTKLTNPIIRHNHAFCLSDGYLECTQLFGSNPEQPDDWLVRKWKQRGRFGNGQLLLIGDKLLVHSESGELMLVAADPKEYRLYGTVKTISGICWNTFGFYKNRVLVRSEKEMACFELSLLPESANQEALGLGE